MRTVTRPFADRAGVASSTAVPSQTDRFEPAGRATPLPPTAPVGVRRWPPRTLWPPRAFLRGRPGEPAWARPALVGLLAATTVLYLWDLSANGYGNSFYAAAVQAGTKSWKAFLFGSLDSSNFITVDKPPASLWLMALSGRIFGFSSWSMLVPVALAGVAAVWLMVAAVRRWFGPGAGLLAGAALALTPVAELMFRYDNPDGVLTFFMMLAGYCLVRALEAGSARWMAATGAALGFAFLAKTLQAFLILPALALVFLIAAPGGIGRRIGRLLVGAVAIVVSAGWWVATAELWPKRSRPYIGGSTDNSVLGLAFGYNGVGRIFGGDGNGGGGRGGGRSMATQLAEASPGLAERLGAGGARGGRFAFGGGAGWGRLFGAQIGSQVSWLIPGAFVLLLGGLWVSRRGARTDRTRAALLLWGGWMIVAGLVLSFAQGTFHPYYTASVAPGIAGLVGVGMATLWRDRTAFASRVLLAVAVGMTGIWAYVLLDRTSYWYLWLRFLLLAVALVAAAGLMIPRRRGGRVALAAGLAAVVAVLGGPAAYAASTVTAPRSGGQPTAGPRGGRAQFGGLRLTAAGQPSNSQGGAGQDGAGQSAGTGTGRRRDLGQALNGQAQRGLQGQGVQGQELQGQGLQRQGGAGGLGGFGGLAGFGGFGNANSQVSALLKASSAYRWAAAVQGSSTAAGLELAAGGVPVMAIGGFTGSDPAPTVGQFESYVRAGKIHYFIGGGAGGGAGGGGAGGGGAGGGGFGPGGRGRTGSAISSWVSSHFAATTVGGENVYDLTKPTASLTG